MPQVKFTVAICTWNRAAQIARALKQLTRIQRPHCPWELVVVNNNSTDETERVLNAYVNRLPLRPVFEPTPGLSHARNTAVRHATGDYIAWTDDDVIVDAGWLAAHERAVERWPKAVLFGGPVRPRFEGAPPPWLSEAWSEAADAFAVRELGMEPFELDKNRIPYGPNFVVRMREQRLFPYDPNLGRKHDVLALGEETAVIRAILARGGTGWWVPDAVVEHWIPKERQTISYLRDYYALVGRTCYHRDIDGESPSWGRRGWLQLRTLQAEIIYALARMSGDPHRWLKALVDASILRGAGRNNELVR
jgi:glycosyltransferase involved in cell wall biosynthesis